MGTYTGESQTDGCLWHSEGRRRHVNTCLAPSNRDGTAAKVAGESDPGCSLLDVPMSRSNQGRIARIASERGAVLPLMALLLLVLMGSAGFAVDLGWLYWNSIEIQHGADAASELGDH